MPKLQINNIYEDLLTFTKLVEMNSYTAVAEHMRTHQTTITRRIQNLESKLGIKLVKRSTRKIDITENGMKLYNSFVQQELSLVNTINSISNEVNNLTSRIRIAIPSAAAYHIISPQIPRFLRENPNITLEVCYVNREFDFVGDKFDVLITNHLPKQKTIQMNKIASLAFLLFCTPEYISKYGIPSKLQDLNKHLYSGIINDDLSISNTIQFTNLKTKKQISIEQKSQFFMNNAIHSKPLVFSNEVIVGAHKGLFIEELANGRVVNIFPEYGQISNYYLINNTNTSSYNLEKVTDFLSRCFSPSNLG